MPNHCESDLVVQGDTEALRAFVAYAEGPEGTGGADEKTALLSAHRFIPYPEEFDVDRMECTQCSHQFPRGQEGVFPKCPNCGGNAKDGYNRGGYEWCTANWGTKWGLYEISLEEGNPEDGRLEYTFQSAWVPPIPVIQAMSKQFPSLTFALDYFEEGGGFMGSCEYEDGQEVDAGQAPYHGNRGG